MSKKYIFLSLLIALVAIMASITWRPKTEVRVGVIAPLTGNFAALGERVRQGFELAEQELEANKGIRMKVIIEDACDAKSALSAVNKLIQVDHIDILGGSFCVAGFVPMLPILAEHNLIGINLAPNPDSVIGNANLISTNTSIKQKGTELGNFAAHELMAKRAAIIYYNTPLGEDYRKYFSKAFEAAGGKIISSQVSLIDATDFRTELTKIKAQNPDLIFVVQLAKPLGNLLKEAHELGISAKILGNSQNEDPTVIEIAGNASEGFIISSDEPLPRTKAVEDFDVQYKKKYGKEADVFARNAYDSLILQSKAFERCNDDIQLVRTNCLLNFFHQVKDYEGASGMITIQDDGTAFKSTSFKIVKEGRFVKLR